MAMTMTVAMGLCQEGGQHGQCERHGQRQQSQQRNLPHGAATTNYRALGTVGIVHTVDIVRAAHAVDIVHAVHTLDVAMICITSKSG